MEIRSYSKYMRISPKKAREVARILPGKKANEGVALLKYIPRKAARMLDKTLKSAMANAENNSNLSADDLIIREAIVEEGPAMKRFRPCERNCLGIRQSELAFFGRASRLNGGSHYWCCHPRALYFRL